MDNLALASILSQSPQQNQTKDSPLQSLVAALNEKEEKLIKLKIDLKDLEDEFQTNYDFIIKRDSKIEELKGQINAKDSEYGFINSRTRQIQEEMNNTSERLTVCQKKIDELMKNISNFDKGITQIQFHTTRLKETKLPVMQMPEMKENLDKLNSSLSDLIKRKDMIFNIVNDIYNQSNLSSNDTKAKYQREIEITHNKLIELDISHKELLNAIHKVEQYTQDELCRIEIQRQDIEEKYNFGNEYQIQISQMKKIIVELDHEIASLTMQQKENFEADQQRQEFSQNQAQRLTKIAKECQEKISNYKVAVHTQKMEIKKLSAKLSTQNQKNDEIKNSIDQLQCGFQKPNFQQLIIEEKEKLNKKFAICAKKQIKAQQKLCEQQQNMDEQLERQKQINSQLIDGINKIVIESRKRTDIVNRERKKSKLLNIEIKSLEGELNALGNDISLDEPPIKIPMPDLPTGDKKEHLISRPTAPPPIQIPSPQHKPIQPFPKPPKKPSPVKKDQFARIAQLTQQLEQLEKGMDDARFEMQKLTEKENELQRETLALRTENEKLRKEAANYEEIKKYYASISKTVIDISKIAKKKRT